MITQSSTPATAPLAPPCFIDPSEHGEFWLVAFNEGKLKEPSWFLRNLTPLHEAILDAAVLLGSNKLRLGRLMRTGHVIKMTNYVNPDLSLDEIHRGMSDLVKFKIIELIGNDFRLTRCVTQLGIQTHEERDQVAEDLEIQKAAKRQSQREATERRLARKQAVIDQHGSRCVYCRKAMHPKKVTIDHVYPRAQGGEDDGNLVPCCESCNFSKRDRTPEQWARDILRWNRPRRTKPRSFAMSCLSVAPAFAFSWLFSVLSFVTGGVR